MKLFYTLFFLLLFLASCTDTKISPFEISSRYFSVYGAMNTDSTLNHIRIKDVQTPLLSPVEEIETFSATLENLQTNEVKQLEEEILIFNENPTFTKETIVEADFENAAITMFTATWCGFCKSAKQLLDEKGITYFEVDVEEYNISKRKLKEIGIEDFFVPQIFVDGVPIGGFSDLKEIFGSDMPVPEVS